MLRDDMEKYTILTGEDWGLTPINKMCAYLDGYDKGMEVLDKIRSEIESECCITVGRGNDPAITLRDVFKIIDKYKEGSEGKMQYNELYRLLINDNIVVLYDNKYSYAFQKKIVQNTLCVKMIKYKGSALDNNKVYGFLETLYDKKPTKEIAKILDRTKVLTVFKKAGVK